MKKITNTTSMTGIINKIFSSSRGGDAKCKSSSLSSSFLLQL